MKLQSKQLRTNLYRYVLEAVAVVRKISFYVESEQTSRVRFLTLRYFYSQFYPMEEKFCLLLSKSLLECSGALILVLVYWIFLQFFKYKRFEVMTSVEDVTSSNLAISSILRAD